MRATATRTWPRALSERLASVFGALGMTLAFFLLLPAIQAITRDDGPDTLLQDFDAGSLEPPEPITEEEPQPPEPEPEEPPPELAETEEVMDLAQLDLALEAGFGGGWGGGDFSLSLGNLAGTAGGEDVAAMFAGTDLDEAPRPLFQKMPSITPEMAKRTPATVIIVFDVDPTGRVLNPRVLKTDDPLFDQAAIDAVKKWRYEPGKRNGKPDTWRLKQPITFPKS